MSRTGRPPTLTEEERKAKKAAFAKQNYDKNKEKILEQQREYRARRNAGLAPPQHPPRQQAAAVAPQPPPPPAPQHSQDQQAVALALLALSATKNKNSKKLIKIPLEDALKVFQHGHEVREDTTQNKHKSYLRGLYKKFNMTTLQDGLNDLDNFKETLKSLPLDDTTKFGYIQTYSLTLELFGFNKTMTAKYDKLDEMKEYFKGIAAISTRRKKEQKQVPDFNVLFNEIENEYKAGSKESLYMHLYREVPCRDDFKLKIVSNPDDVIDNNSDNYIVIQKNKRVLATIHILKHKTQKKYKLRQVLTKQTTQMVRDYIAANNITGYLFGNNKQTDFVNKMFSKIGRKVGINELRHSIASTLNASDDVDDEEILELARLMMHSVDIHQSRYVNPIAR
jgi:hypothetical protein